MRLLIKKGFREESHFKQQSMKNYHKLAVLSVKDIANITTLSEGSAKKIRKEIIQSKKGQNKKLYVTYGDLETYMS